MTAKNFVVAALMCLIVSPLFATPILNVVKGGIQGNNFVWEVDITPDLVLAAGSTPLAVELGFRLTGAPLLSATNKGPGNGGPSPSSTIQWLGAYAVGKGRISQIVGGFTAQNFDQYAGTDTQTVPEPASAALLTFGAITVLLGFTARRNRPSRTA